MASKIDENIRLRQQNARLRAALEEWKSHCMDLILTCEIQRELIQGFNESENLIPSPPNDTES